MAPNLQKFCGRLVRRGLFETKQLESIYRDWRAAAPESRNSLDSFVQFMVLRGSASIDQLHPLLAGIAEPVKATADPLATDDEFDVELVRVGGGLTRRDIAVLVLGVMVGACIGVVITFLFMRTRH